MLDERIDGHGEESGPEAEHAEQHGGTDQTVTCMRAERKPGAASCRWSRAESGRTRSCCR